MRWTLKRQKEEERSSTPLSMGDYAKQWEQFIFNGVQYLVPGGNIAELTALQGQRNPIVMSCVNIRTSVLSEIRFSFQRWDKGRPGVMFGDPSLSILNKPWENGSTRDLLATMELDNCLYGNSYWVWQGPWFVRLNPTKVTIVTTDVEDRNSGKPYGKKLVGYAVVDDKQNQVAFFLPGEIAHYKPMPDPTMPQFRGASWLATILPDISADQNLTNYKNSFLQNAATPNLIVSFEKGTSLDAFDKFKESMEAKHTGTDRAFKTLYLGAGADVKTVGSNFAELLFNDVQAAGETRIAAAAGVPPAILSLSEGMKGSALNSGNYAATRRRFSDITIRPLWGSMCEALSVLVPPPDAGCRLWYDDRDVMFLQADVTDAASIRSADATTIRTLTDGGYDPKSIILAVTTGDLSQLVHTGLLTVQLQPISEKSAEDGDLPAPTDPDAADEPAA